MKQSFPISLLLACTLFAVHVASISGGSLLDDLSEVQIIAQVNRHKTKSLRDLCRMLKRNSKPQAVLVEAAFDEAIACLAQHKEQLAPEDLARIADNLDEHYDALMADEMGTRSTKRFSNVVVHNTLSCGTLFVGGNETVGHNLTVGNDLTIGGNIIMGNCPNSTTTIAGTTNINTAGSCATNIGGCSNSTDIEGHVNINTTCKELTTIGGDLLVSGSLTVVGNTIFSSTGNEIVNGTLKVREDILLPDANAAGTVGVLKLGIDPIFLYNTGTSNFFAGDYSGGLNTNVAGADNISIGTQANLILTGTVSNTIAIGKSASANSTNAIAIGSASGANAGAAATAQSAIAIGGASGTSAATGAIAGGAGSIAIGGSDGTTNNTTGAVALGIDSIALGCFSYANTSDGSTVVGNNAIAIGDCEAIYEGAVSIGNYSEASGAGAIALGGSDDPSAYNGASATAPTSIAVGARSQAAGNSSIAIGASAVSGGGSSIAMGTSAAAMVETGTGSIAIGFAASATGANAIALGTSMSASANQTKIANIRGTTTGQNDAVAVLIDSTGQLGTVSSSIAYKENVRDLGSSSARIYGLRPVAFNYKKYTPHDVSVGLIAEEVAEVMPELVVYNQDGSCETVKYHDVVPHLLNEVQHHQQALQDLCAEVAMLKAALNKLK